MSKPSIQELMDYYQNLLIIQYHNKPKAQQTIQVFVNSMLADNVIFDIRDGYNIYSSLGNIAVDAQLDIIDKYVGAMRGYNGDLLNNADFLFCILLQIINNTTNSSRQYIDESLFNIFGNKVIASSLGDMILTYFVNSSDYSITAIQASVNKDLLPRPMGTDIRVVERNNNNPFFGFMNYAGTSQVLAGFQTYTTSILGNFLLYSNILV